MGNNIDEKNSELRKGIVEIINQWERNLNEKLNKAKQEDEKLSREEFNDEKEGD